MAVSDSTVSISFRYSEIDYVRAMRAHYASRLRIWLDISVVVVGGVAGVYLWQSPNLRWLSITLFSASSIFVLLLVAAFAIIPSLVFRREPKFRDEYLLTFSQEGIYFKTAHIDSRLQWNLYSRALVDSHSYVLYYGARSFTVIPKRVFQNIAQRTTFDQLLADHVPKIVRK